MSGAAGLHIGSRKLHLALVQLAVGAVKQDNLTRAAGQVQKAASKGAQLIALPECFNCPYGLEYFSKHAEQIPGGITSERLSSMAKENSIYLIGGSIPECDDDKLYNTCTIWDPKGNLIAKHRKLHLFDIDIPGRMTFKESDVLFRGDCLTTINLPNCRVGIGICYDLRFAELALLYAKLGCQLLVYPGAFNTTTGPVHWELLQRGRALDNQVYVATASSARDMTASYPAWGHSSIVNPWGEVIATTDEKEDIVHADIDLDYVEQVRQMIPVSIQKRHDLYQVVAKGLHGSNI